jgi:hypothetical protein
LFEHFFRHFCKILGEENHDSFAFRIFLEETIACGWLQAYDIIVCNNVAIHESGYNNDLGEYLWDCPSLDGEPLRILLLPLPTRSPELNPIELLWNSLAQRLRGLRRGVDGAHAVARAAKAIMEGFDFGVVERTFCHCGYSNF